MKSNSNSVMHSSVDFLPTSDKSSRNVQPVSMSPFVTGGPIGSKDAVLVFKTSVLNTKDLHPTCSSSSLENFTAKLLTEPSCSKYTESNGGNSLKFDLKPKFKLYENGLKKRNHDSLSSSENSISSSCDDPIDVDRSILKVSGSLNEMNNSLFNDMDDKIVEDDEKENKQFTDMPATALNVKYRFMSTETKLLRKILSSHGLTEAEENQNFNLLWTGSHVKPDTFRNLKSYQRVNHFPRSYELTRKDRLYKNIEKMQHLRGLKHFDFVPLSFILPLQYRELVSAHRSCQKGPWIVKPAASSRGRGIFIVNSPEQISQDEHVLVSRYIADPLCIDGHKCDIRLYVAVTSFDPLLIYLYEEGLVRLATVKYEKNSENLWNPCMHLCNYSINKYHSDYIKATSSCEDVGHKWTFSALLRHLKNQGCDISELMVNIEDVIIKSIFACTQSIVSACRMFVPNANNCFELYGFDILIDDTLKPWLLEINLSPSLGVDTPLDTKVKASLMTDLLTLVGLPAMSPFDSQNYDSKWNRFKTLTRRTMSTEYLSSSSKKTTPLTQLNAEELRIIRNARSQYCRKGGFVRIFPTCDSLQKYGSYLDPQTGVPISTSSVLGSNNCLMIMPHNYNQLLLTHLFTPKSRSTDVGKLASRMEQYERTLDADTVVMNLASPTVEKKCSDEARRLRKDIRSFIENGNEMSQLQARRAFSQYMECVLRRLTQEPKSQHEKLILKFITRFGLNMKATHFIKNTYSQNIIGKDRSAMISKMLADYLDVYYKETDAYVDNYQRLSMIPIPIFDDFLNHAQESDLESILTLHTNLTQKLPFLYNRSSAGQPPVPPIPTGPYGFLKALPSMAPNVFNKELARIDNYCRSMSNERVEPVEKVVTKPLRKRSSSQVTAHKS